ncbi:MAG TPA: hypothetical protein VF745_01905 [Steroidobacteraceae bacterium]
MDRKDAIRSWLDLAGLAERLAGHGWVFRGEPSNSNPLRPGAGRLGSDARARPRPGVDGDRAASWHADPAPSVLDSYGINSASIYPDLDGLAKHIYWRYRWGMSQTKLQSAGRSAAVRRGKRPPGKRRKNAARTR